MREAVDVNFYLPYVFCFFMITAFTNFYYLHYFYEFMNPFTGYINGIEMKKKTMSFVRRRKWIRAHRLIGLTLAPTPLTDGAKISPRKKSPRKDNENNEEGKGFEKTKKVLFQHELVDHVVDDVDDEQEEEEEENDENNDDENDFESDEDENEDGDEFENSTKTDVIPNSLYHPDDPILGAKNQNPGVNRADTRQFRLQVNLLFDAYNNNNDNENNNVVFYFMWYE